MKIKYIITTGLIAIVLLSGCSDQAEFENAQTLVPISINCVTAPTANDISTYIDMQSGDILVQDGDNTSVKTYHDQNGTKKICLVSGSAHLIRD